MVQRDAAGVWGVPRFLSSTPKIGARGLKMPIRERLPMG